MKKLTCLMTMSLDGGDARDVERERDQDRDQEQADRRLEAALVPAHVRIGGQRRDPAAEHDRDDHAVGLELDRQPAADGVAADRDEQDDHEDQPEHRLPRQQRPLERDEDQRHRRAADDGHGLTALQCHSERGDDRHADEDPQQRLAARRLRLPGFARRREGGAGCAHVRAGPEAASLDRSLGFVLSRSRGRGGDQAAGAGLPLHEEPEGTGAGAGRCCAGWALPPPSPDQGSTTPRMPRSSDVAAAQRSEQVREADRAEEAEDEDEDGGRARRAREQVARGRRVQRAHLDAALSGIFGPSSDPRSGRPAGP